MDNSYVANPNRRGRLPSLHTGSPRDRTSRRRLDLGATSSPNRSDDGSSARTPRTDGGGWRSNVEVQPDEDGPDNDFNPDTFLNTLEAFDQPMLEQSASYLKAKDETISVLQQ